MVKDLKSNVGSVSIAAYIIAAYFLTFSWNFSFDVSLLILLAGAGWIQIDSESHRVKFNAIDAATAGFVLILVISSFLSEKITKSFLMSAAFVPGILLYFLIRHCRGKSDLIVVLLSFLAQIIYLSAVTVTKRYSANNADLSSSEVISQIESLIMIVPNDVVLLALSIPLFLALKDISKNKLLTTVVIASSLLIAIAAISMQSRLAVLTAAVVTLMYFFLRQRRISVVFMLACLTLVIVVDAMLDFALIRKVLSFSDSRIPLWYAAWGMFTEQPLTGFGPHTFGDFYQSYFQSDGFADHIVVDTRHTPWPHNLYLEILAEYGLLGMSALLALVLIVGRQLIAKQVNHSDDLHAINSALLAVTTGFLFAAIFELTLLRLWVVIFMFLLLSLTAVMIEQDLPEENKQRSRDKSFLKKNKSRTANSL